ncbi:hybrid sensor histidine kinase/response regulator [Massilia niastensis]|uniref:hybrid sensor histidine kinase/response regulator n=1 Tax=Massilia niastensis TaxID=544911 RepID=UPI0003A2383C|nr:ATP-binding protein [Massilia niastensis]
MCDWLNPRRIQLFSAFDDNVTSPSSPTMIRRPLRAYLLWLILATLLPGVVGASLLFVHQYQKSRAQFERNTMQTVRALVQTVDSKLLQAQAIAQTLSTVDALEAEDFARVHRQARVALALAGANMNAVLRDRRGQQILNTAVEHGAALPLDHSAQLEQVFASGRPSVSNVFTGAVMRRPTISVDVPVLVQGRVAYVLSIGIRPDYFAEMLTPKSVPDGAIASIIDRDGIIFARNMNPDRYIGRRVTDPLFKALQRAREGVVESVTQEGMEVLTFYSRSELTGWSVGAGVPRVALNQALFGPLAALVTGVTVLFAIGLWLAWQIGGRLARSVQALIAPAAALGKRIAPPPFTEVYVKEAADVAEAIGTASVLLGERARALAAKESELREAHMLGRFGTWHRDLVNDTIQTSDSVAAIYGQEVPPFEQQRGTLLPEESWQQVDQLTRQLQRDGGSGRLQLLVNHAAGHQIWIDVRCESIQDAKGRVVGLRGTLQEVTERVKAEEALRHADRRKDEFLAMLAHELRNPLAPITSGAQLLGQDRLDPARIRQISAIIARQARHMASLVDDLLDVSRVTRGLVTLARRRLDINEIVTDAAEQVQEFVRSKGHRLAVDALPEAVHVMGDRKRLVQVVSNLLHNAAKFTPAGGQLRLELGADAATVWLRVSDNGIGMLPAELERAFEMFVQGERTPDRAQGGLGIGLALVRSLVQLHGGSVQVHSAGIGLGSTFTVSLPRCTESGAAARADGRAAASGAHPLRVLVVDDNADAAQVLAMVVSAQGHQVAVENGSLAALARAPGLQPDVCLLDIGLPDMDGHELARRLRAHPATEHAVLVAVTGYGQEQDRRASAAAGFDHHLTKPVQMGSLERILDQTGAALAAPGGRLSA